MTVEVGRVTAVIDGDISALTAALNRAKTQATDAVSGIEKGIKGQIGSGVSGVVDWAGLGKQTATDYVSGITAGLGPLGTALEGAATALGPTGLVATAAIAGSAVIAKAAWDASSAWEAGMAQISKTTGIEKGTSDFSQLNAELKDLYSTMPTTASEIQNVAKAAGSLGIEKDSIAGFTQVALEMGSAFDIPAEEAAVAVGKVQGQLKSLDGLDSAQFARNFGSAVDYIGNNFNATEKDVLDFSTRVSGSLSALGSSAYEIAGWGGMLSSVFPSAERAAGSFDALLNQLTTNTESQAIAAELLSTNTEDFMRAMTTDPTDTLLRIGSALEALPSEKLMETTKTLGGTYGMDTLTKMVGHTEEWREAIEGAVEAGEKGTSIGESFAAGSDNAKAAIQELKNSVETILIDIGEPALDAFTPVIQGLADGLNDIRTIGENLWEPLTTVITPMTTSVSLIADGIGTMAGIQLDGLVLASQSINSAFETGSAYVEAFREEFGEIVTNTTAFKTVSDRVDGITLAVSDLKDEALEVFDTVVAGFAEAIPTAISGTASAIGGLLDEAGLGGVTDAVGGIVSFFQEVDKNAAEKLGKDAGKKIADGIKDSDLPRAPGEALSSQEARAAVEEAARDLGDIVSDPIYWKDLPISQSIDAITGRVYDQRGAKWKGSHGEIVGTVSVGGVGIAAEMEVTNKSSDVVLKTESGQEIDRRGIYGGEFNGDPQAAIMDMVRAHPEVFGGLTELEQAEFAGDVVKAESLKIQAGVVDVGITTEARLKELSSLDLDTLRANITEIEAEIAGLAEGLKEIDSTFEEMSIEPVNMTVALQTDQARADWDLLVRDIEGLVVRMPVVLDVQVYADDIRAIIADELRAMVA